MMVAQSLAKNPFCFFLLPLPQSEMERSMVEGLLAMSRSAPVYDSEQDDTEDVPPPAATSPPPPAAPAPAPAVKLSVPRRKVTMAGIPITRIPPSPLQQAVGMARNTCM